MKVILAQHYGFCFGVRDAVEQATRLARSAPLTILGELVHNPVVREQLMRAGAEEGALEAPASQHHRVMITAHGASDRDRTIWQSRGYELHDGTCPLVRKAHDALARLVAAGNHPVVIGQANHVEVRGLTGDFPCTSVLEKLEDVRMLPAKSKFGVIAQTTQPVEHVRRMVEEISQQFAGSEVNFRDTVCQPTKNRQQAIRDLLTQVDVMVVVGGRNSNNTKQLMSVCAAQNIPAFHIERSQEIRSTWFSGHETVGVTAGTSTLTETVLEVRDRLREMHPTC